MHVVTMIRSAMEAFRTRDLELCLKLPKMDDPVDRLNRATHLEALKLADDPRALDWGLHMNLAARALERVGDNAVDIGEQVGFLITGEFREFTDASHDVPELGGTRERRRTPRPGSSWWRMRNRSRTPFATTWNGRGTRSRWRPTVVARSTGSARTIRPS